MPWTAAVGIVIRLYDSLFFLIRMSRFVREHSSIGVMKPTTASGLITMSVDHPALEISGPVFFRFVYSSVRISTLPKSLTQDCFWNAHRRRSSFRGDYLCVARMSSFCVVLLFLRPGAGSGCGCGLYDRARLQFEILLGHGLRLQFPVLDQRGFLLGHSSRLRVGL